MAENLQYNTNDQNWQIIKSLFKGFGNNPRNAETFDAMANMNPVMSAYRGGKTLLNMDFSPVKQAYLNEAYGITDPNVDKQVGQTIGASLGAIADLTPVAPVAKAGAKAGAREIARQIETGTGVFGKGTIDPRMYVYKPTFPSKPVPEGVGSTFEREQVRDLLPVKDLSAEDIRGASVFTFPADSTNFGMKTKSVSGNKINEDLQEVGSGGIPFGRSVEHQSKDIGFASNDAAAIGQHDRYEIERQANIDRGGSGRIFVSPTYMADFSEAFSTQPVFLLNSMVRSQGLSSKELEAIDDMVRSTKGGKFKDWVGMADPFARQQLLTGEGVQAGKSDLRKKVYEKYASKAGQKTLDYNIEDLRAALLDPRLINQPANNMGELWYEVNFNKGVTPSELGSKHLDYTKDMGGNYRGTTISKPTSEVFGKVYDDIFARIPKVDKNGKVIPEKTRQLNAINVLRSQKENAHLYLDDSNWERIKRLLNL